MVREPVLDVRAEHGAHRVDDLARPRRAVDGQRRGFEAHHPVRGDDIVQIVDVVAVQVSEEHRVEHSRNRGGRREPHDDRPAGVEQQVLAAGAHERCRAGARRVGNWVAGSEQYDVDGRVPTRWARRSATERRDPRWAGAS